VATNSLELGIDVGDVDLVVQLGPTPTIAAFLQRVGRAGHALAKTPKGRLFPLTRDELVACAACCAVRHGDLDVTHQLRDAPLDVLAQQIVAMCAARSGTRTNCSRWCARVAVPQPAARRASTPCWRCCTPAAAQPAGPRPAPRPGARASAGRAARG
jgi:ATP-dependent Lhr-like helicase